MYTTLITLIILQFLHFHMIGHHMKTAEERADTPKKTSGELRFRVFSVSFQKVVENFILILSQELLYTNLSKNNSNKPKRRVSS
jgi:hypothetical protein